MRRATWTLLLALPACASAPAAAPPTHAAPPSAASAPPSAALPAPPRYAALFDDLIARVARDHSFPPRYARDVGHPWKDDVPKLRDEFARATNRAGALIALHHLQNSLRDAHCDLDAPGDLRAYRLRLGLRVWAGGTFAAPDVRVSEVLDDNAKSDVSVGDAIVSVDGAPIAAWFAGHPFETNELSPVAAMNETARAIILAELPWSTVKANDARVLGIVHDGKPRDVTLHYHRSFPAAHEPDLDHPPPTAKIDCDAAAPARYGDDVPLVAMGTNVCVYERPHASPRVPIVRFVSFRYGFGDSAASLRMVKTDHDVLARALKGADGVVLDLHENRGGNNPFLFMGWFSGGPWDHEKVVTRVIPGLDEASAMELFWGDEKEAAAFADAQKNGRPTIDWRFLCSSGPCVGETVPVAERVTRAPVALVVGPDCMSSCDTMALTWSAFHLGPVVGKQPLHAYTVNRLPIHVRGPESEDLGTLRLAVSESEIRDGVTIEGEPLSLNWEAPDAFETRETWVKGAVEEATKRLRPKR